MFYAFPIAPIDANAFYLSVCIESHFEINVVLLFFKISHALPFAAYLGLVY